MQSISLYWFSAQQQTITSRTPKIDLFYQKFSPEFNELGFLFQKQQEFTKKWLEIKSRIQSRKPHVCGIRGLTLKSQVKNLRLAAKENLFIIF